MRRERKGGQGVGLCGAGLKLFSTGCRCELLEYILESGEIESIFDSCADFFLPRVTVNLN